MRKNFTLYINEKTFVSPSIRSDSYKNETTQNENPILSQMLSVREEIVQNYIENINDYIQKISENEVNRSLLYEGLYREKTFNELTAEINMYKDKLNCQTNKIIQKIMVKLDEILTENDYVISIKYSVFPNNIEYIPVENIALYKKWEEKIDKMLDYDDLIDVKMVELWDEYNRFNVPINYRYNELNKLRNSLIKLCISTKTDEYDEFNDIMNVYEDKNYSIREYRALHKSK